METITLEDQEGMGIRKRPSNFVPAIVNQRRDLPAMPINSEVTMTIDAPLSATQHIEMRTSSVDRAKGFLLASVPLYLTFSAAIVAVVVFGFQVPLASLATLAIFMLMFVAAWIVGYTYTLTVSAEGVSLLEAKAKWDVIRYEQQRRWAHFEKTVEDANHDN